MNKLLENALISIKIGVDDYFSTDANRIFSCTRNLFSGIILLFKSKLLDLCPPESGEVLIKKEIIPVLVDNKLTFIGSGKKTIDISEIKTRFASLKIKTNWVIIEKMQNIRNYIEHYYNNTDVEILRGIIVDTFNIVNAFIRNELNSDPKILLNETWEKMLKIKEVFQKEKDECNKHIEEDFDFEEIQKNIIVHICCDMCGYELLLPKIKTNNIDEAILICNNCSNEIKIMDVFEETIDQLHNADGYFRARYGFESRIQTCPECYKDTFNIDEDICYYCSYEKEYSECKRCGMELTLDEQDCDGLCSYCDNQFQKLCRDD